MSEFPIRTIHGQEAAWALKAQPHDRVPHHDGHWVAEKSVTLGRDEIWVTITCPCGQTFGGLLRP